MPCKRCRHLRRPCEYNLVSNAMDKRASDFASSVKELRDRLRYMGFIIKHHFPNLALDIDSLRSTCDALCALSLRPDQNKTTTESLEPPANAQPSDSPGIEDEDCTIDYVNSTTVRTFSLEISSPAATLTKFSVALQITRANFLIGTSPCTSNAI
jgi:hypothetical protein